MTIKVKQAADHCAPQDPAPQQTTEQGPCEGTIEGKIYMECCCPRLKSDTVLIPISPMGVPQMTNFIQTSAAAFESSGYVVLAHSLTDTGAGWLLGLTIGWYV